MNNVSIGLGNDHVDIRYFQALIIAHVSPAIPETYGPFSVACVQLVYTVWEAGKPKRCARLPWKQHLVLGGELILLLML